MDKFEVIISWLFPCLTQGGFGKILKRRNDPILSYQALLKQINESNFAPVYLFFGDEKYLQEDLVEQLSAAYLGPDADFGKEKLDGRASDLEEIISRLNETGLFSQHRLVIVDSPPYLVPPRKNEEDEVLEESGNKSSREKQQAELLNNYLEEQVSRVPDSILVFLIPGVDKRKRIFKLIDKKGVVTECSELKGDALVSWINAKVKKLGKKIDRAAVEKLLLAGQHNLHYLSRELEKYCAFLGDEQETVTADTVDRLFSGDLQGNVFKLSDALAEGNLIRAHDILELLLGQQEKPMLILFMLVRHYRLLLQAHSLFEEGLSQKEVTSKLGVHPFVARKLREQAVSYNRSILEDVLIALQKADLQIKTGRSEPHEALKLILSRIDYVQSIAR